METNWTRFKQIVTTFNLSIQWVDLTDSYYLKVFDGATVFFCILQKDSGDDQTDFETNFKTAGNRPVVVNTAEQTRVPYGSKVITVNGAPKNLFARFTGQQYDLQVGENVLTYTATFPWAKIIGVEVINCEALDTADLKVLDTAQGTYSGTPNAVLNQFSYASNLPKDFYQRMAQFDADLYVGMVIQITYNSKSAKTIGINFLIDEVKAPS